MDTVAKVALSISFLIHQLYYHKVMFWSGRGWESHQWRTLQMFLEPSKASCWNVFPPHEEARAATLLAAPTGSRDPGHVTEENLTGGFGSWPSLLRSSQPGHWSEARGRQEATVSHIKRLEPPTRKGIHSLQAQRYSTVDRLRSLTQMDTHTHMHASVHAHCALWSNLANDLVCTFQSLHPAECSSLYFCVTHRFCHCSTFSSSFDLFLSDEVITGVYLWQIEQVLSG